MSFIGHLFESIIFERDSDDNSASKEGSNLFLKLGSTNDLFRYRSSPIKAESKEDFPEPNSPITQMKDPFIIFRFKLLRHRISSKDFSSGLASFFSLFFEGDFSSFLAGDFSPFLAGVSSFIFLNLSEPPPFPFFPFNSPFYSLPILQ